MVKTKKILILITVDRLNNLVIGTSKSECLTDMEEEKVNDLKKPTCRTLHAKNKCNEINKSNFTKNIYS